MRKKKQDLKEEAKRITDPADALRVMYDRFWKQAADQWETVARDPQFLSMMAANLNQSLELKARVQEMAVAVLRAMNLPSREDIITLSSRLDQQRAPLSLAADGPLAHGAFHHKGDQESSGARKQPCALRP